MIKTITYIIISLILLTPFVYSDELYNGVISAKQIWFYGAMALLTLVAGLDILFSKKSITIKLNTIDIALLAFYTYYLIRSATTPYMPLLHNQRFLNWTLCVMMYFIIKRIIQNEEIKNEEMKEFKSVAKAPSYFHSFISSSKFSSFIINFLILTALGQSIWGLLQLYGFLPSFNGNFKITGTFFNPAPYALYLAVTFPLALGKVLINKRNENNEEIKELNGTLCFKYFHSFISIIPSFSYFLSFATVIAILLVLPATMIRAAWLGALAGALVVLQYKYHFMQTIKQFLNTRTKKLAALSIAVAMIALAGVALYHIKKGSSVGKLFIWEVTLGKIVQKPLFGYGVGRFEAEYNNWQAEYFQKHSEEVDGAKGMAAGNTKYAFCEFLEMTSEGGVLGLILFLIIIILVMKGLRRKMSLPSEGTLINLFSFFISFFLLALVSFPFYTLPILILFYIILAFSSTLIYPLKWIVFPSPVVKFIGTFTIFFFLGNSFALTMLTQKECLNYYYWDEANKLYISNNYLAACDSYVKVSHNMKYNGVFLQYYAKALYLNKEYNKSLTILDRAFLFSNDDVLYTTMGDAYKAIGSYYNAEQAYIYSGNIYPSKLYPLYLLTKLYKECGDTSMLTRLACKSLKKPIKVESATTLDLKTKIRELILK